MSFKFGPMVALRGATAYEGQVWRFGVRLLRRQFWKSHRWWEIVTFQWFGKEYDDE